MGVDGATKTDFLDGKPAMYESSDVLKADCDFSAYVSETMTLAGVTSE